MRMVRAPSWRIYEGRESRSGLVVRSRTRHRHSRHRRRGLGPTLWRRRSNAIVTRFYLRLFLGLGYTSMSVDEVDVDVSGAGGAFGLALGYAVSDNFIIYGEVFDDIAVNPEVNGGQELGDDVAAGVVALGVGAAYYFQPHNIYLSGTLAMGQVTIQVDGDEVAESDFGPGISLMVGKEWWVSPNWGVGIAGQVFAGKMKDKNDGPDISTTAAAIAFSATFN